MKRADAKSCLTCGRLLTWRRKWERDWDQVRYCSATCRRKLGSTDRVLEQAILALLAGRPRDATICPSEAARVVDPQGWARLMEPARQAARRLVAAGKIQITQSGKVVAPSTARGPIRLRLPR